MASSKPVVVLTPAPSFQPKPPQPQPQNAPTPPPPPKQNVPAKTASDYTNFAYNVVNSMNAEREGQEYVMIMRSDGGYTLELNPNISPTAGLEAHFAEDIAKGQKMYPDASVVKISDTKYQILPKVASSSQPQVRPQPKSESPPLAADISAPASKNPFEDLLSPKWGSLPKQQTTVVQESPQTLTTLSNRLAQQVNEVFQETGIPKHIEQIPLSQGEANALAYERAATEQNRQIAEINAAMKAAGIPGKLQELPSWNNLNKTPTGFAGFVSKVDTSLADYPVLSTFIKAGDEMSGRGAALFEEQFLYKLVPPNIVSDAIANFGAGGVEAVATLPRFTMELATRSPIGAAVYASTSGSKTPLEDVTKFYGEQGWLLAGTLGAGIIGATLEASKGNVEAVTNPLARMAGAAFTLSVLSNPKFSVEEQVFIPKGKILVDSSGRMTVSKGQWVTPPSAEAQAAFEAKMGGNLPELTEAQSKEVFKALEEQWKIARTARIQNMLSDNILGGATADSWSASVTKAFGNPKQWLINKITGRLETGPMASSFGPEFDIEPVRGPTSQLVQTETGEYVITARPTGGMDFLGQPTFAKSVLVAPPTLVASSGGGFSSELLGLLSSRGGGTLQPKVNVSSDKLVLPSAMNTLDKTAKATLQDTTQSKLQAQAQSQPQLQSQLQSQSQTQLQNQLQTQTKSQIQSQLQTQLQSQIQAQLQPQMTETPTPVPLLSTIKTQAEKRRKKPPLLGFKKPSIGKGTIRSDLISAGISKFRFGKATSPAPTESVYKRFAVGGVIPTTELEKANRNQNQKKPSLIKGIGNLIKRGRGQWLGL